MNKNQLKNLIKEVIAETTADDYTKSFRADGGPDMAADTKAIAGMKAEATDQAPQPPGGMGGHSPVLQPKRRIKREQLAKVLEQFGMPPKSLAKVDEKIASKQVRDKDKPRAKDEV